MARQFSSSTLSGTTLSPSGYEIERVAFSTSFDEVIDITSIVGDISISESIFSSSIEVSLTIIDAVNFLEEAHVTGSEKIRIVINRTEPDNEKKGFDIETYIARIDNLSKAKAGVDTYQFHCVSRHLYINQTKEVSRAFKGNVSKLIGNLVTKDLDSTLGIHNKNTKGSISGIYPNIRPLDAITWLLRNCSENSTPFFFYETVKDGIVFDSYEAMLNKPVYRTYKQKAIPKGYIPGTTEYFDMMQGQITSLSSDLDISQYHLLGDGAYGSKLNTLDYSTKQFNTTEFKYLDSSHKLNKNKPFSDKIKLNGKTYSENVACKEYNISINSKSHSINNYHDLANPTILKKQAYYHALGYMSQDIITYGDFNISAGNKIDLKVGKVGDVDKGENEIDEYISGIYLITEITHEFNGKEYTMDMAIRKDSLGFNLNE